MREDRRDDALPEGVIERVVDSGGGNTKPACGLAIDVDEGREGLIDKIGFDSHRGPRADGRRRALNLSISLNTIG